ETNYNPATITTVSNTTPANATNAVLVTISTAAAPSSGEYFYVRYSTDITFASSSAFSQFYFNGTAAQALIPCQPAGPVYYYVFSSNQTAAAISSSVTANGRIAYDLLTLKLNNNGGNNYSYTQGNGTNVGGIYSTPSSCYSNVNAFVTALNAGSVTAPVTCYAIGGGPTETAPAGGISITQTGTSTNTITFKKFGSGTYTIQASAALTGGALNDAVIKLIGSDYVTVDGFTLTENTANTTTAAASNNMTEFGIALFTKTSTDGAQNNIIQNNSISLNRTYTNTFGVYSNTRHTATAVTTTSDITSPSGSNSGNKIYANTISNVNMGITFIGANASANQDMANDIGGNSVATGNTITNWGGAAAASAYVDNSPTSYCIFSDNQTNDNISYNTIVSASISGAPVAFMGIRKEYTASQPTGTITSNINYNTITMTSGFTSGIFQAIFSQGLSPLSTATFNFNNNTILNCAITGASSTSGFTAIENLSAPGTMNMMNNVIKGTTSTSTNPVTAFIGVQNSGPVVNAVNITGNSVGVPGTGAITFSALTSGTIAGISSGPSSTATTTISNNTITGITAPNASSGGSGNFYGIYSDYASALICSSNTISNIVNAGNTFGIDIEFNNSGSGYQVSSNNISNLQGATNGLTAVIGISSIANYVTSMNIDNNIISGLSSSQASGRVYGISTSNAQTLNIYNNDISS
ncbi:MAG TPA: hypothetical protein VKH37_02295, partial [Ferruginibacter sp.]|nr:hypothetical protein [Ferruginibacter sp.]